MYVDWGLLLMTQSLHNIMYVDWGLLLMTQS